MECVEERSDVIGALVDEFRMQLDHLFASFDTARFSAIVETILAAKGTLIFIGVGKSGLIAQKIAATITSSGTKALHISPQDALHGDIGIIDGDDIVFLLSKSGETDELLALCPALKAKGAYIISVVSNVTSRLALRSDESFVLPSLKELCPFDIVPTSSSVAQLIFGDILATALMKFKKISLDEFIQNHPAGRIGRRNLVKVRELMLAGEKIPRGGLNDTVGDILVELSNKQCGCICVVDCDDRLLGLFTDGDLRRALQQFGVGFLGKKMSELMTRSPRMISPDTLAFEAMKVMEEGHPVTVLAVVENDRIVGLIKMHDIVQAGI